MPSDQPPFSTRPYETVTPADIETWESAWRRGEAVPVGFENQTPIRAATDFVAEVNRTAGEQGGEYAQIVYGPDRLGRVLFHYCGDRVLVRHSYQDGEHRPRGVVVGRAQAGVRLENVCQVPPPVRP